MLTDAQTAQLDTWRRKLAHLEAQQRRYPGWAKLPERIETLKRQIAEFESSHTTEESPQAG